MNDHDYASCFDSYDADELKKYAMENKNSRTSELLGGITMLTANEVKSIAKHEITDILYIVVNIRCKIILAALDGDSKCWVSFQTRYFDNKSNIEDVADDVVRSLTKSSFKAEYERFADAEYEEYLRFKISWMD